MGLESDRQGQIGFGFASRISHQIHSAVSIQIFDQTIQYDHHSKALFKMNRFVPSSWRNKMFHISSITTSTVRQILVRSIQTVDTIWRRSQKATTLISKIQTVGTIVLYPITTAQPAASHNALPLMRRHHHHQLASAALGPRYIGHDNPPPPQTSKIIGIVLVCISTIHHYCGSGGGMYARHHLSFPPPPQQ